jgi:hypothetical protein
LTGSGGLNLLASFLPSLGIVGGPGQSTLDEEADGEATEETGTSEDQDLEEDDEETDGLPLWARIAMGIEEAWEHARTEMLLEEGKTDAVAEGPSTPPMRKSLLRVLLKQVSKAQTEFKARLEALVTPSTSISSQAPGPVDATLPEAFDAAIEDLDAGRAEGSESWRLGTALLHGIESIGDDRLPRTIAVVAVASAAAASWRAKKTGRLNRATRDFRRILGRSVE